MLTDELLLLHIWGALKGVRSAQKEIRKVLKAANVEHQMPGTSMLVFSPFFFFRCFLFGGGLVGMSGWIFY